VLERIGWVCAISVYIATHLGYVTEWISCDLLECITSIATYYMHKTIISDLISLLAKNECLNVIIYYILKFKALKIQNVCSVHIEENISFCISL